MKLPEFLYDFQRYASKTSWKIVRDNQIVANDGSCPIVFVYNKKFPNHPIVDNFIAAGGKLGLSSDIIAKIADASDARTICGKEYDKHLRQQIIRLTEVKI